MEKLPTQNHVSSGGVAFRRVDGRVEVALISVGSEPRWQLPKGMIDPGETVEMAALREVREEAGIDTENLGLLDTIEYWFNAGKGPQRTRVHKQVHFYLLKYASGDPADHDHEVNEARWVEINKAAEILTFDSEKEVLRQAWERINQLPQSS